MPKNIFLVLAILLLIISIGAVSAADVTPEKTAVKTGPNTATVTLSVNGSSGTATSSADVVFAIDSSGSMSTSDPTKLRATGAKNFIDQMDSSKDKVGVVNWDNTIRQNQPLTNDFTQAKSVVDQTTNG